MKQAAPVSHSRPSKPQPREIDIIAEDLRAVLTPDEIEVMANCCNAGTRALTRELGKLLVESGR